MKLLKTYDYNGKHLGYVNSAFVILVSIVQEGTDKYFAEAFVEDGLTKTIFFGDSFASCVAFIESLESERVEVMSNLQPPPGYVPEPPTEPGWYRVWIDGGYAVKHVLRDPRGKLGVSCWDLCELTGWFWGPKVEF